MTKEITDIQVCADCILYIANGDLPEDDNSNGWRPEQFETKWKGYQVCAGYSDQDNEFSWSSCDGCGSVLGGSRHHCHAWED